MHEHNESEVELSATLLALERRKFKNKSDYHHMQQLKKQISELASKKLEIKTEIEKFNFLQSQRCPANPELLIYFKVISNKLKHERATKTQEIKKLTSTLKARQTIPIEDFESAMERSYYEFSSHFENDYWTQDMGELMRPDFFSQYKERSALGLQERLQA